MLPHVCRTNLYRQAIDAYQKHTAARAWFENKTKAKEESKENKAEEVGGAWYLYIFYTEDEDGFGSSIISLDIPAEEHGGTAT